MHYNFLTFDVEDYFQVSAFEKVSPLDSWEKWELRVEKNTDKLLELLDESGQNATFFVLGWVAERCPEISRKIAAAGHEVASHGYAHRRVYTQSREEFGADIRRSKQLLEDQVGEEVFGYRAPSFSISEKVSWAYDELYDAGYRYDSSVFPVKHDLYGISEWPQRANCVVKTEEGGWVYSADCVGECHCLREIPVSTFRFAGQNLPITGGGYFRLLPYRFTRYLLNYFLFRKHQPFMFYLHPWEIDPEQPHISGAGWKSRFRHYLNLDLTERRLRLLLREFHFTAIREFLTLDREHSEILKAS